MENYGVSKAQPAATAKLPPLFTGGFFDTREQGGTRGTGGTGGTGETGGTEIPDLPVFLVFPVLPVFPVFPVFPLGRMRPQSVGGRPKHFGDNAPHRGAPIFLNFADFQLPIFNFQLFFLSLKV